MNKKILTVGLTISFLLSNAIESSNANTALTQNPTIAIIDTALDSSIPILNGRIVQEVCILESGYCPNGEYFMEGKGAALLPTNFLIKNGFSHGTIMASTFAMHNSNTNIVFIRIIGASPTGARENVSGISLSNALGWVYKNKDIYNIQAVSMSQSANVKNGGYNYCPDLFDLSEKISDLYLVGIPVFLPTGNSGHKYKIDWPACIDESIAVGGATKEKKIASWSNVDINKTDFYDLGVVTSRTIGNKKINTSGTSISTQVAAANWMTIKSNRPDLSYGDIYRILDESSVKIYGSNNLWGKLINMNGALNVR
jgi:hypothetical protein